MVLNAEFTVCVSPMAWHDNDKGAEEYHGNSGPKRGPASRSASPLSPGRPTANDDVEPGSAGPFSLHIPRMRWTFFTSTEEIL